MPPKSRRGKRSGRSAKNDPPRTPTPESGSAVAPSTSHSTAVTLREAESTTSPAKTQDVTRAAKLDVDMSGVEPSTSHSTAVTLGEAESTTSPAATQDVTRAAKLDVDMSGVESSTSHSTAVTLREAESKTSSKSTGEDTSSSRAIPPVHGPNDQLVTGINLSGLGAALPTDKSGWQTVGGKKTQQQSRKKQVVLTGTVNDADFQRALQRADELRKLKRERPQSPSEELAVFKRPSIAPPADIMDVEETEASLDYKNVRNPAPYLRVAVQIGNLKVIGSMFEDVPGYKISIKLEAGRFGQASILLNFRINKGSLKEPLSKSEAEIWTFSFEFKFNLITGRQNEKPVYSIMDFNIGHLDPANIGSDHRAAIPEPSRLPEKIKNSAKDNWIHCQFTATQVWEEGEKPSAQQLKGVLATHPQLVQSFNLLRKLPQVVQLWFCWIPKADAEQCCFRYLRNFYDRCLPPLFQYYQDGEVALGVLTTPTIRELGNKMYELPDKRYRSMPKKLVYDSADDFKIHHGILPVREGQWAEGITARLHNKKLDFFVTSGPNFFIPGVKLQEVPRNETQKLLNSWCFFYVKLPAAAGGKSGKEATPPVGTRIVFSEHLPSYTQGSLLRQPIEKSWEGSVVERPESEYQKTKTDFCIYMEKRKAAPMPQTVHRFKDFERQPHEEWVQGFLRVPLDHTAVKREIKAINRIVVDEELSLPAQTISRGLQAKRWPKTEVLVDITGGPDPNAADVEERRKRFAEAVELEDSRNDNKEQVEIFRRANKLENGVLAVVGNPGAGKTTTLAKLVHLAVDVGHKPIICGSSNQPVNDNAWKIYQTRPPGSSTRMVRLETSGHDWNSLLDFGDVDPEEIDVSQPATSMKNAPHLENEAYKAVMMYCMTELAETEEQLHALDLLDEQVKEYNMAVGRMDKTMESVDLPFEMKMEYHLYHLMQKDEAEAERLYQIDWLKLVEEKGPVVAGEMAQNGDIVPASERSVSRKYKTLLETFIEKGRLSHAERKRFRKARFDLESRVLQSEVDIVIMTLNNAGSDLAESGFPATVAFFDEAGFATVPSVCVPLTTFPDLQAVFLFGDIRQLTPTVMSLGENEFGDTSKVSALEIAETKGCPCVIMVYQHRMAPDISRYVRPFYPKGLKDHPSVLVDNSVRKLVRKVSKDHYGNKTERGSEVIGIDVTRGISRSEPNGTSLVNHANVDAMKQALEHCIYVGIDPRDISVNCYYAGEKRLAQKKFKDGTYNELSTTDAFQGRQNRVIFLDLVSARTKTFRDRKAQGDSEDVGYEGDFAEEGALADEPVNVLTAFMKDPHRLCMSLSRPMDGLFIFYQGIQLHSGDEKDNATPLGRLMRALVENGHSYIDYKHIDTHPRAEMIRRTWTQLQKDQVADDEYKKRFEYNQNLYRNIQDPSRGNKQQQGRKPPFGTPGQWRGGRGRGGGGRGGGHGGGSGSGIGRGGQLGTTSG